MECTDRKDWYAIANEDDAKCLDKILAYLHLRIDEHALKRYHRLVLKHYSRGLATPSYIEGEFCSNCVNDYDSLLECCISTFSYATEFFIALPDDVFEIVSSFTNPFYGCKTFEELVVKADLMEES